MATDYPAFDPPESLSSTSVQEWSIKQAREYTRWVGDNCFRRASILEAYFGICQNGPLENAAAAVSAAIGDEPFGYAVNEDARLHPRGYSLIMDYGLLMARELMKVQPKLSWTTCTGKRDMSFKNPVIVGFPGPRDFHLDPHLVARNSVAKMMREGSPALAIQIYDCWVKLALGEPVD